MKNRLGWLFGGTAALLVGGVLFLVARTVIEQRRHEIIADTLKMLPGVSQHVRDFRRVKIEDGRKLWQIAALEAKVYEDDDLIVVTRPAVEWTLADGDVIGLRGSEGRIKLDAKELAEVSVVGDIEVLLGGYRVRTEDALYRHDTRRITTERSVTIQGNRLDLHGDGLEVDLATESVHLRRNVTMRFEPEAGEPQG